MPGSSKHQFRGKGRPSKYNWVRWLDGRTHRLQQGRHFSVNERAIISAATHAATRRGLKVRAQRFPDGVVLIQAYAAPGDRRSGATKRKSS